MMRTRVATIRHWIWHARTQRGWLAGLALLAGSAGAATQVPLDRYTPIQNTATLRAVQLAYAQPPQPNDIRAFETAFPGGAQAIASYRQQPYWRMDATTYGRTPFVTNPLDPQAHALHVLWWYTDASAGPVRVGPYDDERHGFPITCLDNGTLYTGMGNIAFQTTKRRADNKPCLLPVSDPALQARIERGLALSHGGGFPARLTAYFQAKPAHSSDLQATLEHLSLTLLNPNDATHTFAWVRLEIDPAAL